MPLDFWEFDSIHETPFFEKALDVAEERTGIDRDELDRQDSPFAELMYDLNENGWDHTSAAFREYLEFLDVDDDKIEEYMGE